MDEQAPPAFQIRLVRPSEYREAGVVTAGAYREFAPPDDPEWQEYLDEIADVAGRAEATIVLVAVDRTGILGTATIEIDRTIGDDDAELPPDTASLRMLGVDPRARGRGIARALVQACIDRARRADKRWFVLRTTERMVAARRLYASMGFDRHPERDRTYDSGLHLIAYRLDLETGPGALTGRSGP